MDPLSDLLRVVRLEGAYFYAGEAAEPWRIETVAAQELSPRIMPAAEHLISYHILTEGRCYGGLAGEEQVELTSGDVIAFPHGDAHAMSSGPDVRGGPDVATSAPARYSHVVLLGDHGPRSASLICGFLGCDRRPPGADGVLTRLAELMFIEVLRRYLEDLPPGQTGWLAGLHDEVVGRVLALLHARPDHPWTLAELAREAASSRSSLAKRFALLVGQPPMQYLTQWRMQVAANLLAQSGAKVATVGADVGYDSEAAFSRSFKKATGLAPGAPGRVLRLPLGLEPQNGARTQGRALAQQPPQGQLEVAQREPVKIELRQHRPDLARPAPATPGSQSARSSPAPAAASP